MEVFNVASISAIVDVPGLYISDITIPRCPDLLRKHGITHILSLTNQRDRPTIAKELGIQQIHVEIEDNPLEDVLMALEGLCAWIENAISSEFGACGSPSDETEISVKKTAEDDNTESLGSDAVAPQKPRVLVHCLQGVSRSGAVIVAYLMRTRSLDYESALALARGSRSVITPNSGFADQLRLWQQTGYSIYAAPRNDKGSLERKTKPEYEAWRSNRGVLLSRGEEEKQKVMMKSMADMAARFGQRRLELKGKKGTEGTTE
ncbi:phosphatases II [Zopfia rhizophila CBS 207.26]|uniref:protein-tyrosine-phosphatase n=1 Tax=Zopfia rhizophila CBS 207.26 TaxID=1314779 RepID=A0A6A6EWM8_9PEZI|nr:phosphatases II [Zopfia rhizophila CBS 207.26]